MFAGLGAVLIGVAAWYCVCWVLWSNHFQEAASARGVRDYPAAEKHLAWCRWARPGDPQTWLLSARNARQAGDRKQFQAWLDEAERSGARARDVRLERLLGFAQWEFSPDVEAKLREHLKISQSDYPLVAEVLTGEFMRVYRLPEAREILNRWAELEP